MSNLLDDISEYERLLGEAAKVWERLKGGFVSTEFKTPQTTEAPKPEQTEQEIMKSLLSVAPGLSEIQLRKLIEDERAKAAGMLTFEACVHLVASSLGFEFEDGKFKKRGQEEKSDKTDLPPVENMAPTKSELQKDGIDFNKVDFLKYGTIIKGKGYLERKLWDDYDKILYAAGYKYSKEEKAWMFQPRDAKQEPSTPQKATTAKDKTPKTIRISDIGTRKSATIEVEILDDPSFKDFNRKDGTVGSVTSFRVSDGSGQARVSMWDEKAKYAMNFVKGDKVFVTSLMVKDPYEGVVQLSGGRYTEITKL